MPVSSIEFNFVIAFLVGMASTLHCVTMCGGIAAGLSAGLPESVRHQRGRHLSYLLIYNSGRAISYALAGGIAGALGATLFDLFEFENVHLFVHVLSTLILALVALYLFGIFPRLARLQFIGKPLWRMIEPFGRRLLPVKSRPQAFIYGMVWGWLPCGLVYSILAWSLTSGNFNAGAMTMLAFGLGTFPTMIIAGYLSTWLFRLNKLSYLRGFIGVSLVVMAVMYLYVHDHVEHPLQAATLLDSTGRHDAIDSDHSINNNSRNNNKAHHYHEKGLVH